MMYNRYIPTNNGIYKRQTVCIPDWDPEEEQHTSTSCENEPQPCTSKTVSCSSGHGLDLGDLLLLCIVILILLESEEDYFPIIIAAAAYLLLQ